MSHATVTLTGTYQQYDGRPIPGKVYIACTAGVVVDVTGKVVFSGTAKVALDKNGSFSIGLPATDDAGLTPTGFGYTITVVLDTPVQSTLAPVTIELPTTPATVDMVDITPVVSSLLSPTSSFFATAAQGAKADAAEPAASLDTDVAAKVNDTASSTRAALAASYAGRLHHLDIYNRFLGAGKWQTGQSTAATTLTSAVAAGASVLPVASAAGIVANQQLLVAEGTAQQEIYTVASVSVNNVTINGTVAFALANGASVTPLWTNSSHLTNPTGFRALAYYIANAKTLGEYVINGSSPKVTFLGNSWFSQGATEWASAIQARIPGATVVNAGVAGNTSAQLLSRFDTDVPSDSTYVVFNEPGVNDDTSPVTPDTQFANFQSLVSKIRALGAIPVYLGHVPLADYPTYSAAQEARTLTQLGSDGSIGPGGTPGVGTAYTPETNSIGLGTGALVKVSTGTLNTAAGSQAGSALATGASNSLFGYAAGLSLTGSTTTLVGANAGRLVTTGTGSVMVGALAGYSPAGVTANATTTGIQQTLVGFGSGQSSTTPATGLTCMGYNAVGGVVSTAVGLTASAAGAGAVALGAGASASGDGSVAIGRDNGGTGASATAANSFVLGTANHRYKMPGLPTTNPGAGSGILWNNAGVVTVA